MAKALNTAVDYLVSKSVNPAGRPGWSSSKDGWVPPPVFIGAGEVIQNWDLESYPGDEGDPPQWVVYNPTVIWSRADVEATVTITNNPFEAEVDKWLVARINSLTTPAIVIECIAEWAFFPACFDFAAAPGYDFETAYIPLWSFHATTAGGRVQLGDGLFGQKRVQPFPSLEYTLYPAASNVLRTAIDLR